MEILSIVIIVLAVAAAWYLFPYAMRLRGEARLKNLCRSERAIVLTYDDGPGETVTPKLLDLLGELEAKATFFVLGSRLTPLLPLARRALDEGHEIGSHSEEHLNAWKALPTRVHADVTAGAAKLGDLAGARPSLFRPPYGKLTLATWLMSLARRYTFAWWTVDSSDSLETRAPIDEVCDRVRRRGGGVVLMHDYEGYRMPNHADYVLSLTRRLVELSRAEDYHVMTFGELMGKAQG